MTETLCIVWITNKDEDNYANELHLRNLIPASNLRIYDDLDECVNFMTDFEQSYKKIYLIISLSPLSGMSEGLENIFQTLLNIDSIYILCKTKSPFTSLCVNDRKIHGIYSDIQSLANELLNVVNINQYRYRRFASDNFAATAMTSLSTFAFTTAPSGTFDTNHGKIEKRQEAECMYSQLAREILVSAQSNKTEMLDFCRQQYADDQTQLRFIQEFEDHYHSQKAIFWYTRDTFLYRLLNRALRENDIDTLYSLRYFIKDLHSQIEDLHSKKMATNSLVEDEKIITLYRGQLVKTEEFEHKVKRNLNGFLSVTSFLSTTIFKQLAIIFAGNGSEINMQSVLFQIDIDQSVQKFPYANISTESDFGEAEGEILFTMGSVFRILSIESAGTNMWYVHLKLTGEEDEELRNLINYMRGGIDQFTPEINLARLLLEMAEYHKAIKYLQNTMQDTQLMKDPIIYFYINNELGDIYKRIEDTQKFEEYYRTALEVNLEHLPENHPALITANSARALLHERNGVFEQALLYYNKMLESSLKQPESRGADSNYRHIAMIYTKQERYSEAMEMCSKALDIQLKTLPQNHPEFAETYKCMGELFHKQNKHEESTRYMAKALEVQQHSLPSDHPDFIATYYGLDRLKETLEGMKKKNQRLLKQLPEIYHTNAETAEDRCRQRIQEVDELLEMLRQTEEKNESIQKN